MARELANIFSCSEVRKEKATEACRAREKLAADASRRPAGSEAAIPDVEGVAGPRPCDQAACKPGAVAEVVETSERGLWLREVCRSLLR